MQWLHHGLAAHAHQPQAAHQQQSLQAQLTQVLQVPAFKETKLMQAKVTYYLTGLWDSSQESEAHLLCMHNGCSLMVQLLQVNGNYLMHAQAYD